MPLKVEVTAPPAVFNPYEAFKTEYHLELLRLFRGGAMLYVWRCSSPHNWYIQSADGEQYMVSGDRETCKDFGSGSAQLAALQRLGRHSFASKAVVTRGSRFENGMPESEGWTFDAEAAMVAEKAWNDVQAEVVARQATVAAPTGRTDALSELAIALLRTLKVAWEGLPRYPELAVAFKELDSQGMLELMPTGRFRLVPEMAKIRVPRGLRFTPG